MSAETPNHSPEIESKPDNDRKFVVTSGAIDHAKLTEESPEEYDMTVDYTVINDYGGGNYEEEKIARKVYDDGSEKILKIAKVKLNGNRDAKKAAVAPEKYADLVTGSVKHLFKRRHELVYRQQDGAEFPIKYDILENGKLYMIEVGANIVAIGGAFNIDEFPADLVEVSGDKDYEGHQMVDTLAKIA